MTSLQLSFQFVKVSPYRLTESFKESNSSIMNYDVRHICDDQGYLGFSEERGLETTFKTPQCQKGTN
jgi:hypothetical protein